MNQGDLLVIGAGGHARIIVDTAVECGYNVVGIIDLNFKGQEEDIFGVKVVGGPDVLEQYNQKTTSVFVAIGNNESRKQAFCKLQDMGYHSPTLVHPAASVSRHVEIGDGTLINAGAVVNAGTTIGPCCIINTSVVLDHEVKIGAFTHIAPGCAIGGRSQVGSSSFVGLGTAIIDSITIGDDVIIGAGSTIIKDVAHGSKVVGVGRLIN
ncbi:MAG: acetyltransferase [Flavobacteriales bacterium]|nr:acetyltransferase [Flavobacteriales bacterium]